MGRKSRPTSGKKTPLLGSLELEIMQIIWILKDASVAEVLEKLPAKRHHNTVMTVMKRLAEKGFLVQYARDGRTHGYKPARTQEQVSKEYLSVVQDQLFDGSLKRTLAAFVGRTSMNSKRTQQFQKMLEALDDD